jgi:hypothetical protein
MFCRCSEFVTGILDNLLRMRHASAAVLLHGISKCMILPKPADAFMAMIGSCLVLLSELDAWVPVRPKHRSIHSTSFQ